MTIQAVIENKLSEALDPSYLQVINESHRHSVPENSETHFKITLVANRCEGQSRVARHQLIYRLLAEELAGPVHALALHIYTPAEWQLRHQQSPESPDCLGGSKADKL